jgi:hypothetical protein
MAITLPTLGFWLMRPSNDEEVIDGGPLLDEVEAVMMIVFNAVSRVKTPYRHLEDIRSLAQTLTLNAASEQNDSFQMYPSSLLTCMTIVNNLMPPNKLLIPSQVFTSFIRKLLFHLSSCYFLA